MLSEEPLVIRSFHAVSEPETCQRFFEGHVETLRSYGLDSINSSKNEWFYNPEVYGVIAEIGDKVVGGVKIHKVGGTQLLPVEESVGYMDERLYEIVRRYAEKGGAGEACGLWNSREVSGWGVSSAMMLAVVSLTEQLDITTLFGLSSDHTLPLFRTLGYRVIRSLGDNGDFVYPTPQYLARVIKMNARTLSGALPYNREMIFALRAEPDQTRIEKSNKGTLQVEYQLRLPVTAS